MRKNEALIFHLKYLKMLTLMSNLYSFEKYIFLAALGVMATIHIMIL